MGLFLNASVGIGIVLVTTIFAALLSMAVDVLKNIGKFNMVYVCLVCIIALSIAIGIAGFKISKL